MLSINTLPEPPLSSVLSEHLRAIQVQQTNAISIISRIATVIPGAFGLAYVGGFCKKLIDHQNFFPQWVGIPGWIIGSLIPITLSSRTALSFWRMLYKARPTQFKGTSTEKIGKFISQLWNKNAVFCNHSTFSGFFSFAMLMVGLGACFYATSASAFGIFNILKYLGYDTSSWWSWFILSASQFSSFTTNFTLFLQVCANPLTQFLDRFTTIIQFAFSNDLNKQNELFSAKARQLIIDAILGDYINNIDKVTDVEALKIHFKALNELNPEKKDIGDYLEIVLSFWKEHIFDKISDDKKPEYLFSLFGEADNKLKESYSPRNLGLTFIKYSLCFLIGGSYALPNLEAGDEAMSFATSTHRTWIPNELQGTFSLGTFTNISFIGVCSFLANAPITTISLSLVKNLFAGFNKLTSMMTASLTGQILTGIILGFINLAYVATQVGYGLVFTPAGMKSNAFVENTYCWGVIPLIATTLGLFSDINFLTSIFNWFLDQKAVKAANNISFSDINFLTGFLNWFRSNLLSQQSPSAEELLTVTPSSGRLTHRESDVSVASESDALLGGEQRRGAIGPRDSLADVANVQSCDSLNQSNDSPRNNNNNSSTDAIKRTLTQVLARQVGHAKAQFAQYNNDITEEIYHEHTNLKIIVDNLRHGINMEDLSSIPRGWSFFSPRRAWGNSPIITQAPGLRLSIVSELA